MPVIGLTGGIASGKSTVAGLLREKGALVIDADEVAREVVRPSRPALEEIRDRFGTGVLAPDGTLDRGALARLIFSDPEARRDLNAIMHPRIFEAIRDRLAVTDPDQMVFVEAALLAETYSQASQWLKLESLVVVDAPRELQVARLKEKGITGPDVSLRLAAQMESRERLAQATHVIQNAGSLDDLRSEVDRVWRELEGESFGVTDRPLH